MNIPNSFSEMHIPSAFSGNGGHSAPAHTQQRAARSSVAILVRAIDNSPSPIPLVVLIALTYRRSITLSTKDSSLCLPLSGSNTVFLNFRLLAVFCGSHRDI